MAGAGFQPKTDVPSWPYALVCVAGFRTDGGSAVGRSEKFTRKKNWGPLSFAKQPAANCEL